ncbi:MAG: DedA family protein [Nitrospirae bacterium]|nr:DedA family protein [Magnetococcales bacterium]
MPDAPLIGLFLHAFLAATLIPLPSEIVLGVMMVSHAYPFWILWITVTLGNTLGALFNWVLGRTVLRYQQHRWFPFTPHTIEAARNRFSRHGAWWLLLSWLPIIGDPLTFAAGMLRISLPWFLFLVTLGKGGRYLGFMLAADAW